MESFLTRNDAVMRAASSAALFADTKGGGADGGWRRWCWRPVLLEAGGALGPASTGAMHREWWRTERRGLTERDGIAWKGACANRQTRVGGEAGA